MKAASVFCALVLCATTSLAGQQRSIGVPLVGNSAFGRRVVAVFDASGQLIPGPLEIYDFDRSKRVFTFANASGAVQRVSVAVLGRIEFRVLTRNQSGDQISNLPSRVVRKHQVQVPLYALKILAGHLEVDTAWLAPRSEQDDAPEPVSIEYDRKTGWITLVLHQFAS